ncbi:MAG: molybdenum cofactor guanylyltransferase [Armatimonadota bacterium]|nr:molybdenum cofactor guanylyltransferase [Armatimonadota bacterium]MDR5696286.1 molybdenum cofactor guanylyltransferase [Armatimonadota bacterium]
MSGSLTGIVLAGGPGRIGAVPKLRAVLAGRPLVCLVVERLRSACDEILVVAKDRALAELGLHVVVDPEPMTHPLIGLAAGLRAATAEWCFVCGCDMPFVNPGLVRWMASQAELADVVIPVLSDGPHALHAVYARGCHPVLEEMAVRGETLWRFLRGLRARIVTEAECRWLDPDLRSFFVVETESDLHEAQRLLESEAKVR